MKVMFTNREGRLTLPIQRLKTHSQSRLFLPVPSTSKLIVMRGSAPTLIRGQPSIAVRPTSVTVGRPMHSPPRQRWTCSICRKSLSSKRSYEEHMNIHNDSRPFRCDHCEYGSASQMTLRRHVLRNHTNRSEWGYRCPYCGESYMEPASYQQHILSRHVGRSATFGCPYVLCSFLTKCFRHFREHLAKHDMYETFAGPSDRHPYSFPDDELQRFLVDDDCGIGFMYNKRQANNRRKTVLYTNDRITRDRRPITNNECEFMKQPIRLNNNVVGRRRVIHEVIDEDYDDMPPILEEQELLSAGSDWIETEIEIPSNELLRLPDGTMEMELD